MKGNRILVSVLVLGLVVVVALATNPSVAQEPASQPDAVQQILAGNAFTYQGYLSDGGSPANGNYDFFFSLYADAAGTQWVTDAAPIDDHPVVDGLFTVQVDVTDAMFGDVYFHLNGDARWLRIGVRPGANTGSYTYLTPLQPLTPAPYALALPGLNTVQNDTSANVLGGYSWNYADPTIVGATVGGGGNETERNEVRDDYATVGGGASNVAGGLYATIPGGYDNSTDGDYSLAAGRQARALHTGSFVWADAIGTDLESERDNQFRVRASGGAEYLADSALYGLRAENTGSGDAIRAIGNVSLGNGWGALFANNSGTSPAVVAETNGTYSGYFYQDIYVGGSCVGCTLVYVALNDGDGALETGDLVAANGVSEPLAGTTEPVLRVRRAEAGDAGAIVGVVQDRAMLVESDREGRQTQSVDRAQGPAAPGEYLFVVVQGVAQVKADATEAGIAPGQRLAAAERSGHARALRTRTLEGMVVTEGVTTVGIALAPLETGTGLIPVLVTLR